MSDANGCEGTVETGWDKVCVCVYKYVDLVGRAYAHGRHKLYIEMRKHVKVLANHET